MASILNVDSIKNAAGTGAPDFANGLTVAGGQTISTIINGNTASTFTFSSGGTGTSASVTLRYQKIGDWVTLMIPGVTATAVTSPALFRSDTAIPSAYRPLTTTTSTYGMLIKNNGSDVAQPGIITINTNGTIDINRDGTGPAWSAGTGGLSRTYTVSYYVGTGS